MRAALAGAFGAGEPEVRGSHAVIVVEADAEDTVAGCASAIPSCA